MSIRTVKDALRTVLPWKVYWGLKRIRENVSSRYNRDDLDALAKIFKTDKGWHHHYTPVYQHWFDPLRNKPVRLLEIGIGGYDNPLTGGDSLRMWKSFFRKGIITGIDIYDKSALTEPRIRIYQGDQADKQFLRDVSDKEGPFDIIIDDGSHMQSDIITSFETLFPLMSSGGIYVIEDTQTSYRPKYGGSTKDMWTVPSAMNYFIKKIHTVNHKEWIKEDLEETLSVEGIGSISFYQNLIMITRE